jgi:hypothetical protein
LDEKQESGQIVLTSSYRPDARLAAKFYGHTHAFALARIDSAQLLSNVTFDDVIRTFG